MGYYTWHELTINRRSINDLTPIPDTESLPIIAALLESNEDARYALNDDGTSLDGAKWYDRDADLTAFSLSYPDLTFVMHCTGEEGEQWISYYENGKSTTYDGELIFPAFDAANFK